MNNLSNKSVSIIGGGIFGCEIAIALDSVGISVNLFEMNSNFLIGASKNNQNRLHLGFHYPRDIKTGYQCVNGFDRFSKKYEKAIFKNFKNAYFISDKNSKTSVKDYYQFCKKLGVDYIKIKSNDFPLQVNGAQNGILCNEYVYDTEILRDLINKKIKKSRIKVFLNHRVQNAKKNLDKTFSVFSEDGSEIKSNFLINTTYSDINRITKKLNFPLQKNLYEYTVVPIVDLKLPSIGITIMDGPFTSLLPYGKTGKFLIYHVDKSVIKSEVNEILNLNWLYPNKSPFLEIDKRDYFYELINECSTFFPFIKSAKLMDFLEGPRMVLANKDHSDERPSLIQNYENQYFTVFSGKIDHSVLISEEFKAKILNLIKK